MLHLPIVGCDETRLRRMGIFVNEGHVMTSTIQPAKSNCSSEVIVHATQAIKVTSIHTDTWFGLGSDEKEKKRKKKSN